MPTPPITYKEANKRYRRAFWPVIVLYVVLCFAGPMSLQTLDEPPKWAWALMAVLTGLPIVGVFWLIGRLLRETDEYTRQQQTDALLFGGGVALSVAVIWGFLDLYDVTPPLWSFWLGPIFFGAYGLAACVQRLRNRPEQEA
jgi:hypothetical protein